MCSYEITRFSSLLSLGSHACEWGGASGGGWRWACGWVVRVAECGVVDGWLTERAVGIGRMGGGWLRIV